mgnify:CR=1 FL=1
MESLIFLPNIICKKCKSKNNCFVFREYVACPKYTCEKELSYVRDTIFLSFVKERDKNFRHTIVFSFYEKKNQNFSIKFRIKSKKFYHFPLNKANRGNIFLLICDKCFYFYKIYPSFANFRKHNFYYFKNKGINEK